MLRSKLSRSWLTSTLVCVAALAGCGGGGGGEDAGGAGHGGGAGPAEVASALAPPRADTGQAATPVRRGPVSPPVQRGPMDPLLRSSSAAANQLVQLKCNQKYAARARNFALSYGDAMRQSRLANLCATPAAPG